MRKEKRTIVVEKEVFVASDGKEFDSEYDCEYHEYELKMLAVEKRADEKLLVKTRDDFWPSIANPSSSVEKKYKWFKIKNREDLEVFCEGYEQYHLGLKHAHIVEQHIKKYPEYICLVDYPRGPNDPMWFTLSEILEKTDNFLKQFGMKIVDDIEE